MVDADSRDPLIAANIQVADTYRGTVTNSEGRFELAIETFPATLLVRYIGYEETTLTVGSAGLVGETAMRPVVYNLGTLTVSAEDPATNIMRKVIEQKQLWRTDLSSWESEAYTRFVARNDTGIVAIMESASTAFWDKERGFREVSKGSRSTENLDLPDQIPAAIFVTNLYDDDIEIAGFKFLGPTHPRALDRYRYRLVGRRMLGQATVYDIDVEPKSKLVPLFRGRISVLDSAYAMIEVDLAPNEAFFFPVPINDFRVTYQQQYSNFGKAYWLPVDFRSQGELEFGIPGLRFPTIRFEQLSRLADYEVNEAVPDSLYEQKELVVEGARAENDTTAFEDLVAIVPLSADEEAAYATIDSSFTMKSAYKPEGVLAKLIKTESSVSDDEAKTEMGGSGMGFTPDVWYNRVDGFYFGIQPEITRNGITMKPEAGRSFGSKRWTTGIRLLYKNSSVNAEVGYREGSNARIPSAFYSRTVTGWAFLLGAPDYNDYYESNGWYTSLGVRPGGIAPRINVTFRTEEHKTSKGVIDRHVFDFNNLRLNAPVAEGRLNTVRFSVEKGIASSFVTGGRHAEANVEISREGFGSDFDFVRAEAIVDWRFPTFAQRRFLSNALDVRLVVFGSSGSLPAQRLVPVESAIVGFRPFGVLRSGAGLPFEGDEGAAFFWEHHFRTLPFELVGLRRLARMGTSISVFGGHAKTRIRPETAANLGFQARTTGGIRHEVGIALSNVLGIPLRIDVTRALDPGKWYVSFGLARAF